MKILLAGNYFYPEHAGGIEFVCHSLSHQYREAGHEVRWLAADVPPRRRAAAPGDVAIRAWNVTEERLGFPHPLPLVGARAKIREAVRWCDALHLHDCLYCTNVMAFAAARRVGRPVLLTQHAMVIPYRQRYKRALQIAAYRTLGAWMLGGAERVVFVTDVVREGMRRFAPEGDLGVVQNGVDTDFFAPRSPEERERLRRELGAESSTPLLLFVGRMVERKGVRLIRPLVDQRRDWRWVLVGRPDDIDPGEWRTPNLIHLQDVPESRLRDLLGAADLLVHPSVGEGLTLTASQSLACGTPVMISPEALEGVGGEDAAAFFPVEPRLPDLEDALSRALADRGRLAAMRLAARSFAARRLSWKETSARYLQMLNEIVSAARGAKP